MANIDPSSFLSLLVDPDAMVGDPFASSFAVFVIKDGARTKCFSSSRLLTPTLTTEGLEVAIAG